MVDRLDQGVLPSHVLGGSYETLWKLVSKALYRTHVEGRLKVPVLALAHELLVHAGTRGLRDIRSWVVTTAG